MLGDDTVGTGTWMAAALVQERTCAARAAFALAAALALALIALALPGVASAQLIFDRGNDIYGANDDGSGAHPLVSAASLGMDAGLGSPAVEPGGSTLLFRGTTKRNRVSGHSQDFYGDNANGAYSLSGGTVARLSAPPAAAPASAAHTSSDLVPELAPSGRFVYQHQYCAEQAFADLGWVPFCQNALWYASLASGTSHATGFATDCDVNPSAGTNGEAVDPAADPASASLRVAYGGCSSPGDVANFIDPRAELIVSGAGHGGQVTVALGADTSVVGDPSAGFSDPSFSPDGGQLVAYTDGGVVETWPNLAPVDTPFPAGLYVYSDLTKTTPGRLVLASGSTKLASPRFAGSGQIVFVAGGSVYSVSASCNACSLASATKLYDGGTSAATQAFSVAWTAGAVAPMRAGGGTPPGGGGTPPGGGASQHRGLHLRLGGIHRQHLSKLLEHGLTVKARCRPGCRLSLKLTVSAKTARQYRLISQRSYRRMRHQSHSGRRHGHSRHHGHGRDHLATVTVGRASKHLKGGRRTTVRIKLTRKSRHKLRHAHHLTLRLQATARARGAQARSATRKVSVRR